MVYLKGFAVWLIIICTEVMHGAVRGIYLEPVVGDFRARQIAVFTGTVIIFTISLITVKWLRAVRKNQLVTVGVIWLFLTLAFEIIFGYYVIGYSRDRILSDFNLLEGGLLPLGLAAMTLSPFVAGKLRKVI